MQQIPLKGSFSTIAQRKKQVRANTRKIVKKRLKFKFSFLFRANPSKYRLFSASKKCTKKRFGRNPYRRGHDRNAMPTLYTNKLQPYKTVYHKCPFNSTYRFFISCVYGIIRTTRNIEFSTFLQGGGCIWSRSAKRQKKCAKSICANGERRT